MFNKTLYKMGSGGKVKVWSIEIERDLKTNKLIERTGSGYVGFKIKYSSKVTTDKGIQKAQTKVDKKVREGYVESIEEAQESEVTLAGMQAKFLSVDEAVELAKLNNFIADFKYNGLRGTYHRDTDKIISKGQKEYDVDFIKDELRSLCDSSNKNLSIIDFEFYAHGYKVNEIASMVKSKDNPDRNKLMAYIFDGLSGPSDDTPAMGRKILLSLHGPLIKSYKHLHLVPHHVIKNPLQIKTLFDQALSEGLEGLVLRLRNGQYDWDNKGRRSLVMAKVKPLFSREFLAVGCSYEKRKVQGEWKDLIIYTCVTEDGKPFSVTPEGDVDSRCIESPVFDEDSWYTVEFREYTTNGIPFHSVGKGFRIPEDIDTESSDS